MNLEQDIKNRRKKKDILLMTHLVVGYPSLDINREVIRRMAAAGVDCIELQIPFSEPMADGPVIMQASHRSLALGTTVEDCFRLGQEMAQDLPQVNFLFMTYYNILFKYGEEAFLRRTRDIGFCGTIISDLPPEEGQTYRRHSQELGLTPVLFFAPTSTDQRLNEVASLASGLIYCVARRGVTGRQTTFDDSLHTYLQRCRKATKLPLAVGFGLSSRDDLVLLQGQADMAVIGTAMIKLIDAQGPEAVTPFIHDLLGVR